MTNYGSKSRRRYQTEGARKTRQDKAQESDKILELWIKENPGLTSVGLERIFEKNRYNFQRSFLKNALKRLEERKRIIGKLSPTKDGKIVKKYYANYEGSEITKKSRGTIEIPVDLLYKPEQWQNSAIAYGMKNNEIKICSTNDSRLETNSLFSHTALVKTDNKTLFITLPIRLANYYDLDYNNYEYDIESNVITLRIVPKPTKLQHKSTSINSILLLEDNDYWINAFVSKFKAAGYTIVTAKSIEEARHIDQTQQMDYYILDDEIKFKKEAAQFFIELKHKHRKIHGTLITSYPMTDSQLQTLTKLGFSSIVQKHRSDDENMDAEEITNEQLIRLEMIAN